jgi:hypothetical protein
MENSHWEKDEKRFLNILVYLNEDHSDDSDSGSGDDW